MKYILQLSAGFILILVGKYSTNDLAPHFVAGGVILLISFVIIEVGYDIYLNFNRLILATRCAWLALWRQYIRFSMSYQYRIKIRDKYLLVKNSNWDFYQHVGGKYKRLPITQKVLQDFEATDDLKLVTHGLKKDDLAVFVPAKNALKFIDWFSTKKDREISHWREFYEELIDGKAKILTQPNFAYVNYNYVKSVITPLKRAKAPGWNCWEILQYDVLDLLPTESQERELEKLFDCGDTELVKWANTELINSLGFDSYNRQVKYGIGEHTKWVLNLKYSKE